MKKIFVSLIFLIFFVGVHAQNISFERITTSNGLSQNDINDIFQDRNGFLWIGTNDGLNRYDGYRFKTYRFQPNEQNGLNSNLIFSIKEDEEGNLWLGTSDKGLIRFNVKTETFLNINQNLVSSDISAPDQVICILPRKNKTVWVGTPSGIAVYKEVDGKYELTAINRQQFPIMRSDAITGLKEDQYGRVWVGTIVGLYAISEKDGRYEVAEVMSWRYVHDMVMGNNGVIVACSEGIVNLQVNWETLSVAQSDKISTISSNCLLETNHRDLFAGTNSGLFYYKKKNSDSKTYNEGISYRQNWDENSLSKNVVTCLFEDKTGIVWIGTNGGGLNKYNPHQHKFRCYTKTRENGSLSYNKIRSIFEDRKKNIWIGTEGGGLNFLSASQHKNYATGFTSIDVNTDDGQNYAYSATEIGKGDKSCIMVGVGYPAVVKLFAEQNGVLKEVDKGLLSKISNSVFCSVKDRSGNVWLGTYGLSGLYKYSIDKDGRETLLNFKAEKKPGALTSNIVRSLFEDSYGNIWIGTDNGLNLLTPDQQLNVNPHFYTYRKDAAKPKSLSHNYVLPIFQSSDQTIWVGTMGGGLNKMFYNSNPDSICFEAITTQEGLPNNSIKGILEDDYGFLWISSNKGLTRYDIKDKLIVNYDESDGLQDNEFGELACAKLSDGEMLFGGTNGLNAFYPKDILRDMTPPEIAFTDFQILNKSVAPGEELNGRVVLQNGINYADNIKLKYRENSFAIYFASLHFSAPQKNSYKYKLEGFDSDWIRKDASDRIATYTNLSPGTYTFKLLASNNDGIWNSVSKTLTIVITPPWYLTNVAKGIYIILFLALLWFFQRYSLIRIKKKNELIMEHFEKEKIEELSQMKLRFFTNISHEFRTPLTLIIGPLEKLRKKGGYDAQTTDNLSIMHRNASILLRLINQLVDFRKFEQGKMKLNASEGNIVAFLKDVYGSFSELANDKKINYLFSAPNKEIQAWFDSEKLERIMYNLLSNAFKFTPEHGEIKVSIDESETAIFVHVADNGIGIPLEFQEHIFERFYQAKHIVNRKVGSTGIGLSFIKGLVELHQGEISFMSDEGKGATFTVKLKKGSTHLKAEEKSVQTDIARSGAIIVSEPKFEQSPEEEDVEDSNKKKLLLVEDNFELRKFLADSLKANYQVELAENGKEGLEKALEFNPDVVISDVMMPVMSGFELCEAIKTDQNISHIPVILLTAKSTEESRIAGYKLGADAYIAKPFNLELLEARLENLIENREKLRELLRTNISIEPSEVTTTTMDEKFLNRVLKTIEENIADPEFKLNQLAQECGMSQLNLNRKIKSLTGQTPKAFLRQMRLKRAAQLLATTRYTVLEIANEVGFLDIKYFRTCFKEEFGLLPSEYVSQHKKNEL